MPKKKLTYEYVYNYFLENGCELLEKEYVNYKTKMKYRCSCGNISSITFGNFKMGKRCSKCSGNKRYTINEIREICENNGFELLSNEYKNMDSKLTVKCQNGHVIQIRFSQIKRGDNCSYCSGNRKFTYEEIYNYFKDHGCELLEKEYINSQTPMRYICSCGNITKIRFDDFKKGKRCKKCSSNKLSKKFSHSYDFVKKYIEDQGYELLSNSYKNNEQKLVIKCPNGHVYESTFQNFKAEYRCTKCKGNKKYFLDEVKQIFSDAGCVLLEGKYVNAHTKMKYVCQCGNISYITLARFKRGQRCQKCKAKQLAEQYKLDYDFVKKYIESNKYNLISKEYVNAHKKLHLKCDNGHDYFVSFDAFKRGERCLACQGINKYDLEYVKEYFKKHNCVLLETEYISSKIPMKYICSCGNLSTITFVAFKKGQRCKKCGIQRIKQKQKKAFEEIVKQFKKNGLTLLTKEDEYENKYSKLSYICQCGNISSTTWSSFKNSNGTSCDECKKKKISERLRKYTIEKLKPLFEKRGFTLLSTEFINSHTPLEFICDKGHLAKTYIHHFKNGSGCKTCAIDKIRGENNPHWNPNRTDEDRIYKRQYPEYKSWRAAVFQRDDFTCQRCGKRNGVYLNAHHLYSYAEYIDLRLDINNGITLCKNCHNEFHEIYGNKKNTKEQFEEFMTGIVWNYKTKLLQNV